MFTVNIWPILVASVVAFAIGALWYSPVLFGKEWMALAKINQSDVERARAGSMWKSYISQFVATLVMFGVLSFIIWTTKTSSLSDGAFLGLLIWIGFTATEGVGALLWERKPFRLVLIQCVGTLISLVVGGAIIGAWM